jgi:hypothetical protein
VHAPLRIAASAADRGPTRMASIGEDRRRNQGVPVGVRVLAHDWRRESIRQWLHLWRWPAGLIAGLVLWLALIAVVGAATPAGSPVFRFYNTVAQTHFSTISAAERDDHAGGGTRSCRRGRMFRSNANRGGDHAWGGQQRVPGAILGGDSLISAGSA